MSAFVKLSQGKFISTIFSISSIVSIFIHAEKAEAIPLNTTIPLGSSIKSNNQCFRLDAQNDGNLVIYKQSNGQALWNTATYGRNVNRTIFQSDGNLVIYNTSNQAVWASRTDGRGAANLYMQDDGNLVIYNSQSQAIWASNTLSSCGKPIEPEPIRPPDSLINNTTMPLGTTIKSNNQCFSLNAQTDGNLVLYRKSNGQALWDTKTYGRNVNKTIFQNDGNLVIYNTSNQAVWASRTDGRGGKRLTVQDDGNIVIYNAQNQALWATNTMTSCTQPTQRESKKKVDAFVNKWLGKIQITRNEGANYYPGQCVTLIARYLQDNYSDAKTYLGLDNGGQTAAKVPQISNSFLPISNTDDPIPGSIISFPNAKYSGNCGTVSSPRLCGHVALVVSSRRLNGNYLEVTILDSNWDSLATSGKSIVSNRTITIYSPPPNSYATGPTEAYGNGISWTNPKD